MRVILSGGGTAGHIYPALTVAEELRAAGHDRITFVGTPDGLEARLVREAGVAFTGLSAKGFDRARPWTILTSSAVLGWSTLKAIGLLRAERPDVVAGFGGYVSIPVGLAAALTRTPLVLHEQNSVPGLANKVLSRWAHSVGVTYEFSSALLKHPERAVTTGNPVRSAVLRADRAKGRELLDAGPDAVVLLVFGGSRGARHLNRVVAAASRRLLEDDSVIVAHVAGRAEVDDVRGRVGEAGPRYRVFDYVDDMGSLLAAADLVVARAGATSIAEITALGRPSVLVPYPYATDDHQTLNAASVSDFGAGVSFADADIDAPDFIEMVVRLLSNGGERATMCSASSALGRPDAARRVVALIESAGHADVATRTRQTSGGSS